METANDTQLAQAILMGVARGIVNQSKDHEEMVANFIIACNAHRIELMTNMAENLWQKVLEVQEGTN